MYLRTIVCWLLDYVWLRFCKTKIRLFIRRLNLLQILIELLNHLTLNTNLCLPSFLPIITKALENTDYLKSESNLCYRFVINQLLRYSETDRNRSEEKCAEDHWCQSILNSSPHWMTLEFSHFSELDIWVTACFYCHWFATGMSQSHLNWSMIRGYVWAHKYTSMSIRISQEPKQKSIAIKANSANCCQSVHLWAPRTATLG